MTIERRPSSAIRIANAISVALLCGLVVAELLTLLVSDFVPSPLTVYVAKIVALLIGLFYAVFSIGIGRFGWDRNSSYVMALTRRGDSMSKVWIRAPFMALLSAGFAWTGLSGGFPWVVNLVVGHEGSMVVIVDGWESGYSRSGCARPTLAHVPFGMLGRRALCTTLPRSSFPIGRSIILIGRASALGLSPEKALTGRD